MATDVASPAGALATFLVPPPGALKGFLGAPRGGVEKVASPAGALATFLVPPPGACKGFLRGPKGADVKVALPAAVLATFLAPPSGAPRGFQVQQTLRNRRQAHGRQPRWARAHAEPEGKGNIGVVAFALEGPAARSGLTVPIRAAMQLMRSARSHKNKRQQKSIVDLRHMPGQK